jgi:ketosteroid isomerase-like protein
MTAAGTAPIDVTTELLEAADSDIVRFFSLFSDDCIFRLGNNDIIRGRENIQAWVADYLGAVAGMRHEIVEMWSEGDVAAARVEVTYTMNSGATFTLPAVTRTRVRDGRVSEYLIFMDPSPVVAASA